MEYNEYLGNQSFNSHSNKEISSVPVKRSDINKNFFHLNFPQKDFKIEKNKLRRIKSGKIAIEGTLDLHGLSLLEAEKQLKIFVGKSLERKKRFLLIITGKGKNSRPDIYGKSQTIKSEINKWISDSYYSDKVQYISQALDKHGGGGAFYFFLRNSKNIFS